MAIEKSIDVGAPFLPLDEIMEEAVEIDIVDLRFGQLLGHRIPSRFVVVRLVSKSILGQIYPTFPR